MTVLSGLGTAITDADDATLVRRFRSTTDPQTRDALFERLYATHHQRLYGFCLKRLLPDRDAAREALQETFLTAWTKLDTLEHPEALESWLYQIAWRRCAQQRRKRDRATGVPLDGWEESTGRETARRQRQIAADDADFAVRRRRALALVRNIAAAQGPTRQRFLDLYVGEELTGDTLARRLGRAGGSTKEDNEALRTAFRSNVLAKDPRNRKACGRLTGLLATAVTYWTAQAANAQRAGDPAAADRARRTKEALERFLADPDPDSTKALPDAVCRTVTRHTGQCPTCRGSARRSIARWFPAVAPFAFTDVIMDAVRDRFVLVSASVPADGGTGTEVKGRRSRRSRGRCGGSSGRPGRPGKSPGLGRRITVNTLVALALSLGVVYGSGGADLPMAQLPWSSPASSGEHRGTPPASGGDPAHRTPAGRTSVDRTGPERAAPAPPPKSSAAASPATRPASQADEAAHRSTGPADGSPPPASTQAATEEQASHEETAGTQPSGQLPAAPAPDPAPGTGSTDVQASMSQSTSQTPSQLTSQTPSQSSSSSSSAVDPSVQHPSAFQEFLVHSGTTSDEPG
ncbi:RNA polymerase sigma factor [Streptomyces rimosus]|uniref:RNA polymerase sigma factor n=1 Tax=Streptomyces rimosus TaxID=1927 RepID=UPI000517D7E1|nr:RNA polymerase sigma factor [Streptomyces rimosus]